MELFLIIVTIILANIIIYQAIKLKNLEQKTLDSFRVICKKLKSGDNDAGKC